MYKPNSKTLLLVLLDMGGMAVAYVLALLIYFDFQISKIEPGIISSMHIVLPIMIVEVHVVFVFTRMYRSVWRLAGMAEIRNALNACIILVPVLMITGYIMRRCGLTVSLGIILVSYILEMLWTVGCRCSYRLLRRYFSGGDSDGNSRENIMIIGGGSVGQSIIREYSENRSLRARVVCVIDDNSAKKGKFLEGVPIVGNRDTIVENSVKYKVDVIVFAISMIKPGERAKLLNICQHTNCKIRTVPGLAEMVSDKISTRHLREIKIEDLLERDVQVLDNEEVRGQFRGRVVLVTGAGGSIGSELCRQIVKFKLKKIIIFDIYENSAYDLQQQLRMRYPDLDMEVLIGDMQDEARVDWIMEKYYPDIVFHAAAHKHVPLMEDSPNEAIKNNVFGTLNLARSALKYGVERFVLISTDKAVNPTNIMGASKRICEMIIQSMNGRGITQFVAVRFGNVLGSNGSVVPLFQKQIASGGPVTVTDPRIIRYFMTIPEAVSLVIQAAVSARGGEIFVLDMGDPVKIDDMARNLIRLNGLVPDEDIKIVYTGLRPGEKLYEELLMAEEGLKETANKRIFIAHPIEMNVDELADKLETLKTACFNEDPNIRDRVAEIVTTYKPGGVERCQSVK